MSSRGVTSRGVDKFVELVNDRRFRPFLFASGISSESPEVQRQFYDVVMSYLQILASNHSMGIDHFRIADLQAQAHTMYSAFMRAGGVGDLPSLDLSMFDTNEYDVV